MTQQLSIATQQLSARQYSWGVGPQLYCPAAFMVRHTSGVPNHERPGATQRAHAKPSIWRRRRATAVPGGAFGSILAPSSAPPPHDTLRNVLCPRPEFFSTLRYNLIYLADCRQPTRSRTGQARLRPYSVCVSKHPSRPFSLSVTIVTLKES